MIFLILFVTGWSAVGLLVWIGFSVRRKAVGALWAAPFALLGAVGAGALTGVIGLNVEWSFLGAAIGSVPLCGLAFRAWDAWDLGGWFASWSRRDRSR